MKCMTNGLSADIYERTHVAHHLLMSYVKYIKIM